MTNSKVFLIKGWKIEGSELVDELLNKLDEVSEDYYEEFEDYLIVDCVSGEYAYIGTILGSLDCDEDCADDVEITKESVSQATPKWNKMLEENPKVAKVFKEYTKGDAKFYVVYHIY